MREEHKTGMSTHGGERKKEDLNEDFDSISSG